MSDINYSLELGTGLWDNPPGLRETSQAVWESDRDIEGRFFPAVVQGKGEKTAFTPKLSLSLKLKHPSLSVVTQKLAICHLGVFGCCTIFSQNYRSRNKAPFLFEFFFSFEMKPLVFHTWQDELNVEKRSQNLISTVIQCIWSGTITQRSIWTTRLVCLYMWVSVCVWESIYYDDS